MKSIIIKISLLFCLWNTGFSQGLPVFIDTTNELLSFKYADSSYNYYNPCQITRVQTFTRYPNVIWLYVLEDQDVRIEKIDVTVLDSPLTASIVDITGLLFGFMDKCFVSSTSGNVSLVGDTLIVDSDTIIISTATAQSLSISNDSLTISNGNTVIIRHPSAIQVSCSDLTTALTTGSDKAYFRMPYDFELTEVRASVLTAPTGSVITIEINESGSTILSTDITIDATEKTSTTAAMPPVISDSSLADDAEITIGISTVGSTIAGAGLQVTLIGYKL